jgi:hypothetical protein
MSRGAVTAADRTGRRLAASSHPVVRCPRRRSLGLALVALLAAACSDGGTESGVVQVRVDGLVLRGPTQPVCMVGVPCDAPFSAGFTVRHAGLAVLRFHSDADGRFTIRLAPGDYTVVPDADAPVLDPARQAQSMTVPRADSISVVLSFDTGIR